MKKNLTIFLSIYLLITSINIGQDNLSASSVPNYKITFSERFRIETWDNAVTLSNNANGSTSYNRNRSVLTGQWFPNDQWEAGLSVTNEFRYYFAPTTKIFNLNELLFDQLYIKYTNSLGSISIGRQNLSFGEGFIVLEGTPLDGSRTTYFNAAVANWNIDKTKKLTAFITYTPQKDNILPLINDQNNQLIEQPEKGFGLYFTGQSGKLNLQTYFILKQIESTNALPVKSNINTVGSRIVFPFLDKFTFTGEGAYQFGDYGTVNRSAAGGYAYCDYSTNWNVPYLPGKISFGGIYLSGDDPKTKDIESWDPVFSRWPKWSESYIYTLVKENNGKIAYWSNFASIYAKLIFTFNDELNLNLDLHHMSAPEYAAAGSFPGGSGKTRGDLIIAKLNYKINDKLSGHLLWENFKPGNFYFNGANGYNWSRVELLYKI